MENPYWHTSTIREIKYFFGRKKEIKKIFDRMKTSDPQCISIVGERKVGKSSLLYYILKSDEKKKKLPNPEKYIFTYLDFQQCVNVTEKEFWKMLYQELEDKLPTALGIKQIKDRETFTNMAKFLDTSGYKLILLFDEFDKILENKNFGAGFFSYLRFIANNHNTTYIVSTKRDLKGHPGEGKLGSPFFNIFTPIYLGLFQEDEALDLIRSPSAGQGIPLEEDSEFILKNAGLFPFFIQKLCYKLFECKNEQYEKEGSYMISPEGYKNILSEFRREAIRHFEHSWDGLSREERGLLTKIAVGKEVKNEKKLVEDLEKKGYVTVNENIEIFSDIFLDFIKKDKIKTMKRNLRDPILRCSRALGRNQKALLPLVVGALCSLLVTYLSGDGIRNIWAWIFIIMSLIIAVLILLFSPSEND